MQLLSRFQITDWIDFDKNGRANCPCCGPAHGSKDKSLCLSPKTDWAYKYHRGCTPAEIRAALGAPASCATIPPQRDCRRQRPKGDRSPATP
ncbi:MAG: hypothetical protein F6K28_36620, partial [Microcoleus sp. SIO2G3]|nr:hypothetical protein [Microcoleus sp. SIO2G3]